MVLELRRRLRRAGGRWDDNVRARRTCFCTTSERCRVMGGVTGAVSCAAGCNVAAAGRVQLEGGLGRQLGDGACMALANRSCLLALLVMERGELIFTASGAPSGALAYGFFGATGVLGFWLLRGMCSPSECVSPAAASAFEGEFAETWQQHFLGSYLANQQQRRSR